MARVQMPPGCTGLNLADGTRVDGDRNGVAVVDDRYAGDVNAQYKTIGLMSADQPLVIATKAGRVCTECAPSRRWNAWSTTCPRCGAPTSEENPA